jgi:PhnB protein
MKTYLAPSFSFDGNAKEVMEFYQGIFGGKLDINLMKDTPMPHDDSNKDLVVHAQLTTDYFTLMGSDASCSGSPKPTVGDNIQLSVVGGDMEKISGYFNALKVGGKELMPLEKQFWGDVFGACVDKYGINWAVNITEEKK